MYGRYNRLGEFAKLESLKAAERKRVKAEKSRKKEFRGYQGRRVSLHFYCLICKKQDINNPN